MELAPLAVAPTATAPPVGKKVYVRRKKVEKENVTQIQSPSRKFIVARKIKAGQTIEDEAGQKVSLPRANSMGLKKVEMLPQSLAVQGNNYAGPPVDKNGDIIEWGILGDREDFMDYEYHKTGKMFQPPPSEVKVEAEGILLTARTRAREEEAKLEEDKLEKMLVGDRIVATKDQRALARWEVANKDWANFKQRMIKKLQTNEGSLLVSTTDDYRNKSETYDLVEKATPIWNKYGTMYWQMTLRNETSHFVPLGNEFSGLYCQIGEPAKVTSESIRRASRYQRRDDMPKNNWRDSDYLNTRIKQLNKRMHVLQPNFHGQLAALEHPARDAGALGDLKIVGTDLFAPDPEPEEEEELDATIQKPRTPDLQTQEEEPVAADRDGEDNMLTLGPQAEVVTKRVVLSCKLGNTSCVEAEFVNRGSTSITFEWKVRKKGSEEPCSEDASSTMWGAVTGSLLPGQRARVPFLFMPSKPGIFLETLELHTTPAAEGGTLQLLMLKGVCELPDDNTVVRTDLEKDLFTTQKADVVDDLVDSVVDNVLEPKPDEHFHRYCFYTKNRDRGLWYYKENCRKFNQLAEETFQCHKRAVRAKARWDFSADSLLNWIETIPFRNSHKVADFKSRWEALVAEASIRPAPDSTRYKICYELLSGLIHQIPRLARGLRADFGISEPLPHVAKQQEEAQKQREEEERIQKDPKLRRAAAKKAKQGPPKLSPEEATAKAAADAEAAAIRAEVRKEEVVLEEERAKQEEEYNGKINGEVKGLMTSAMQRFADRTVRVDDLPSANTDEENATNNARMSNQGKFVTRMAKLQSRPVFSAAEWGNGVTFPELGELKEDPNDKKKKKKTKPKKLKKGEVIEVKPVSPLFSKDVVLVAAGLTHAVAYTTDRFFYLVPNPDPSAAPAGKKGAKKDKSARGGAKKSGRPDDEKDEGDNPMPKSISELQGYNATFLLCGNNVTAFATEEGGFYVFDHETKTLQTYLEGKDVVSCAMSPDGQNFFIVTRDGELWSMGENTKVGFLGHNDKNKRETFEVVKALADAKVIAVTCGTQHACCLAEDGSVFGWGEAYGCGIGDKKPKAAPELIPGLTPTALAGEEGKEERVVQLVSGHCITMARTSNGRVLSWGKGADGSLGHGDNKDKDTPAEIKDLVALNLATGDAHSMAMCEEGKIFTWGKGAQGSLGHKNTDSFMAPELMKHTADYVAVPVDIRAGGNFSLCLLQKPNSLI